MSLKRRTFSAGRWTTASALMRSCFQILQVMILARLLLPADFGLMAVAASLLAVLSLFTDIGLSRAIIHFENISKDALASLFWLNLLMGASLSVLFAITAPLLADIFNLVGLKTVLLAVSPIFVLSAAGQQFRTLAEKEFRFASLAINEIGASVLGFIAAVAIALCGGGVYALVGAALVTSGINSVLAWLRLSSGYRPHWHLRFAETKRFLRFGGYLVGEGILSTITRQADVFVGGLNLSPTALGTYSVPRDLSLRVSMVVNPIITRVGFPVMSRLQDDISALKSVYLQTLRMTASVNFPVYLALGLFADEIVALLYGPHWKGARLYLRILAVWGLVRSTGNPVGSLLHAVGAVRRAFWWNFAVAITLIFFYWVATSGWGLTGLATSLVITQVGLLVPVWYFLVRPYCGATLGEYFRQLGTPLMISLIAGVIAWLATRNVPHGTLRLALGSLIGGTIYLGLSWILNRRWFDAMWTLLHLPTRTSTQ
ncbi:MAG TPA: MOP flippase family protein [Gammaproteobacteria bacterium]|jgi:O-antigen/teichoic acid export membrane protein|nr:MOP flippase family protein [Gammaproteobacteria bacterium]